jgi:hypothetical protein
LPPGRLDIPPAEPNNRQQHWGHGDSYPYPPPAVVVLTSAPVKRPRYEPRRLMATICGPWKLGPPNRPCSCEYRAAEGSEPSSSTRVSCWRSVEELLFTYTGQMWLMPIISKLTLLVPPKRQSTGQPRILQRLETNMSAFVKNACQNDETGPSRVHGSPILSLIVLSWRHDRVRNGSPKRYVSTHLTCKDPAQKHGGKTCSNQDGLGTFRSGRKHLVPKDSASVPAKV